MTHDDFAVHYHSLQFRLACHENKGVAFQTLFERVMSRYDPTFILVKPAGREGDWKSDGFSQGVGTVYQCYAPEGLVARRAAAKIHADFAGAKKQWGSLMRSWIFVWAEAGALPPQSLNMLLRVRRRNPSLVIDDWGRDALWQIVLSLPMTGRVDLFGVVPELTAAAETTAAEVQSLLNYLVRIGALPDDGDTELTDLADKLERNNLGESVRAMVRPALPVARVVESYVARHPDPDFSSTVARALRIEYDRAKESVGVDDADLIFGALVHRVCGTEASDPRVFWAGVGIVTHYFQICDIFDR